MPNQVVVVSFHFVAFHLVHSVHAHAQQKSTFSKCQSQSHTHHFQGSLPHQALVQRDILLHLGLILLAELDPQLIQPVAHPGTSSCSTAQDLLHHTYTPAHPGLAILIDHDLLGLLGVVTVTVMLRETRILRSIENGTAIGIVSANVGVTGTGMTRNARGHEVGDRYLGRY